MQPFKEHTLFFLSRLEFSDSEVGRLGLVDAKDECQRGASCV